MPQSDRAVREVGTCKWFNAEKGYGFITPDAGGKDVFVHVSAVTKAGWATIGEGARVSYEMAPNAKTGKNAAVRLEMERTDAMRSTA